MWLTHILQVEEAARYNASLTTKIPLAREECARFIYVVCGFVWGTVVWHIRIDSSQVLLQHASLANVLSAPALEGFRSSMMEWRAQLQPLQDAASISMLKKVSALCVVVWAVFGNLRIVLAQPPEPPFCCTSWHCAGRPHLPVLCATRLAEGLVVLSSIWQDAVQSKTNS